MLRSRRSRRPGGAGAARLSEALASPAAVNDDVLGARCGVLAKMAPHPAVLKIDTKHKCSGVLAYATILDPSWPCSLLSDGRAFLTGDSRPPGVLEREMQWICRLSMLPPVAGAVDHRVEAATSTPHAPHKWLAASDRDSPGLYADKDGDEALASSAPNGPELLAAPRLLLRSSCPCSSASVSHARAHFS